MLEWFRLHSGLLDSVGAVVRAPMQPGFHQCGAGSIPYSRLEFVGSLCCLRGFSPSFFSPSFFKLPKIRKFTAMITLLFQIQPQYNMNFIYISHYFTAREDMNSTNRPCFQYVASHLTWSSISQVSRRSRVRIPLKPWYFSVSSF